VDDLWDGTFFEGSNSAMVRNPDFISGIIIKDAMVQYEKEHGAAPTDFNQITGYFDTLAKRWRRDKIDEAKFAKIYHLMMTPVQ